MVISTCGENRCEFCCRGSLDCDTSFQSICSDKKYEVDFDASCATQNYIYLITCRICSMKYVGKTTTTIRTRLNGHRGNIRKGTEAKIMLTHFTDAGGHGIASMVIKPIELCKDIVELGERENYWIAELNTVYPYGLNLDATFGKIKNAYLHVSQNKSSKTIYSLFNKVSNGRGHSGGKRKNGSNSSSQHEGLCNSETFDCKFWLSTLLRNTQHAVDIIHKVRTALFNLELVNLKAIFLYATELINVGNYPKPQQHLYVLQVIRDMGLHKLQKLYKDKKQKPFLIVNHVNKLVEKVNINGILNSDNTKMLFPVNLEYYAVPRLSFRYSKSIRSKIVNYHDVITDANHDNIVCKCDNYDVRYKDHSHGHIVTGDMGIIKNNNLRDLLNRGLGYHDQQVPDKVKAKEAFISGLDSYIHKTSIATSTPATCFKAWKSNILEHLDTNLSKCKEYHYYSVLKDADVKAELSQLHDDFVLTPVDKASNNVAIVCKRYYLDVMSSEIENSPTFELVSDDSAAFLDDIQTKLSNLKLDMNLKIPYLYATVKMHKVPKKFRFITAGCESLMSNPSIATSKCLKLLLKFARTSYKYKIKYLDNNIFIVDNREKVVTFLDDSNQMKTTNKSVTTWDFATLYTKIPHEKLKEKIGLFVRTIMGYVNIDRGAQYVCYSKKSGNTYFSKSKSSSNVSYSADSLVRIINTVIDNAFVRYHGKIYRQKIGIPMGTNVAPYLANIFLHIYEHEYLSKLVENNEVNVAKKLANVFRYQDDCISLNDNGEFGKHYNKIYPTEMTLECTNISKSVVTFLDLRISIFRGMFTYRSYDKRNDFNFKICSYPNLKGNIPTSLSMAYLNTAPYVAAGIKENCVGVQLRT